MEDLGRDTARGCCLSFPPPPSLPWAALSLLYGLPAAGGPLYGHAPPLGGPLEGEGLSARFHCLPENSRVFKVPSEGLSVAFLPPPPPPPGRTSLWSRCLLLEDHCRRRTSLWFSLFGGPFCGVNSPRRTSLRFFSPPPPLEDLSMVLVPPTGELYGFLPSPWRTSVRSASPRRTSLCFPSLLLEVLSMVTSRGEGEEVTSRGRSRHLEDH